jgi:hypothetical protein
MWAPSSRQLAVRRQHNLTDPCAIYGAGAEKLDDLLGWCNDVTIPASDDERFQVGCIIRL